MGPTEESTMSSKVIGDADDAKEVGKNSEKHHANWFNCPNYFCNYCEKSFPDINNAKKHINVVHNINLSKGYAKHLTDAGKKYTCKICRKECEHSRRGIKKHLTTHNMELEDYERKYETQQYINKAENPKDLLDEVLDDTLNELCEPEKELRDDTRKRKSSGGLRNVSKHRKTSIEKTKIENRIEFSDSSDDED